jgi:hypothetical protein
VRENEESGQLMREIEGEVMYVHAGASLEVFLAPNRSLIDAPEDLRLKQRNGGSRKP